MALVAVVAILLGMVPAAAAVPVDWELTPPLSGTVVDGVVLLEVTGPGVYPLLVIDDPAVAPPRFQLDGVIRHEGVEGVAYLEMWTVLADGSRYFTRTLAEAGPMAVMSGNSEDRPVVLPFELGEDGPVPSRLEVNLVTSGSGRFWISPIEIVAFEPPTSSVASATTTPQVTVTNPPTPVTTAAMATAAPVPTPDPQAADGNRSWLWLFGLAAAGLGASLVVWRRRTRREARRMQAIDSLR